MTPVLGPHHIALLQRALGALQSGQAALAERMVRDLGDPARQHPDALYIFASARAGQGDKAGARAGYEAALRVAGTNPQLWNAYGNHLHDMGLAMDGMRALQRAVSLQPAYGEGWINLAIVAIDAGDFDIADDALNRAARLMPPRHPRLSSIRGALNSARGRYEEAAAAYRDVLIQTPDDLRARHNLATALRSVDRPVEALDIIDGAIAVGVTAPQSLTLRAHLLAELGRFDEAVIQYRAVLDLHPDYLDAQDTYARLLPQIGRQEEAMDAYDRALVQHPTHMPLLLSAITVAKDLRQPERALGLLDRAASLISDQEELAVARMQALDMAGRSGEAIDMGLRLAETDPVRPGLQVQLAQMLLASGDVVRAERHATTATRQRPFEQKAWALLTVIWRLLNDEREHWLAGYDSIVTTLDIGTPPGWSDQASFLADLSTTLDELHVTTAHPADQTLRGGTQTRGELFDRRRRPAIMALQQQLKLCVEDSLSSLPREANHPFLSRRTDHIRFAGAWSVRLHASGHHVQHYHPQGWLSSAFYVALPDTVGLEAEDHAGSLLLGCPEDALGLPDLEPRRIIRPQPGRLALFPSYVWHGTAPFSGEQPRLTVAFDALPA